PTKARGRLTTQFPPAVASRPPGTCVPYSGGVEEATELGEQRERLKRVLQGLEALLAETDAALESAGEQSPSADAVSRLEELRARRKESVRQYLSQNAAFAKHSREEQRKTEDANPKEAIADQRARPDRGAARYQALCGEL